MLHEEPGQSAGTFAIAGPCLWPGGCHVWASCSACHWNRTAHTFSAFSTTLEMDGSDAAEFVASVCTVRFAHSIVTAGSAPDCSWSPNLAKKPSGWSASLCVMLCASSSCSSREYFCVGIERFERLAYISMAGTGSANACDLCTRRRPVPSIYLSAT